MLFVGKQERKPGLTWGTASQIKSIVRSDRNDTEIGSDEWCIQGMFDQRFSDKGDSDPVVFDLNDRIRAIMGSVTGMTDRLDVTYATPWEWLREDVGEFLGGTAYPLQKLV